MAALKGDLAHPVAWLRARDRNLAATRRAFRAAIVMPAVFAVADNVIANPVVATFASFGSFALLLLVGFGGPMRSRLTAQAALSATTAAFICLATLASNTAWLAVVAMAIVAFVVLFVGVVSSVLASATTALLLAFILPVSIPAPASSIPYRLEGWGIAAGAAFLAVALLWPGPAEDPMRRPVTVAIRALASRLRSDVAVTQGDEPGSGAAREAVVTGADNAVSGMRRAFFASPYRPTGLSSGARSVVRLVDDLNWLNDIVRQEAPGRPGHPISRAACRVELAAAAVLEQSAQALDTPAESVAALHAADGGLDRSLDDLQRRVAVDPPIHPVTPAAEMVAAEVTTGAPDDPAQDGDETEQRITEFLTSLDPSFRAQEVSYAVRQVAAKVEFATLAEQRSILDRVLGRQPTGLPATRSTASELAAAHVRRHSVWLHNSIRGAVGLSLATLITTQSGVQHGFWVLLATLSVLRSNALSTGQNAFRALAGTVVGFIVGAALLAAIGTNRDLLWALLPVVVLLFGLAPATISFAAGQAAFTLTLVILFNIIQPAGWRVGLIRVEDIAIGCGVSLLVGIMFWPRGAASAFGQALAEAYQDSARYLQAAVEFGMGRCDMSAPGRPGPSKESLRAAAASRLLDDAYRGYLAERGAKFISLADATTLLNGVAGLRLAADAVYDLWRGDDCMAPGDRAAAKAQVEAMADRVVGWYDELAAGLGGPGAVPDPLPADPVADQRLAATVRHDLRDTDGLANATAVRMVWTGDHLDAARRLADSLVGPTRKITERDPLHRMDAAIPWRVWPARHQATAA
jgi:hypothetical protein